MKREQYIQAVTNLGLSPNEAAVYVAALSLGPTTVLKIAEASGLERTNIYRVVESLQKRGLMSVEVVGLKKRYVAEDPSNLKQVLEARQKELEEVLPGLEEMYGVSESGGIKYYKGVEGIKTVYEGILEEIKLSDYYYVISNLERWYPLDSSYFDGFVKRRVKRGVHVDFLLQDSRLARKYQKYEQNFNQSVKILPEGTELETDTIITPFRVVTIEPREPITTFVIENKSLINAHKQYFEVMWGAIPE